jgi:hypothetical protein
MHYPREVFRNIEIFKIIFKTRLRGLILKIFLKSFKIESIGYVIRYEIFYFWEYFSLEIYKLFV